MQQFVASSMICVVLQAGGLDSRQPANPIQVTRDGSSLTGEEIESAIALAKANKAEPYQLSVRTALGLEKFSFGYVVTPYMRVALAARYAFSGYKRFSAS